jgi:hypothetical protein
MSTFSHDSGLPAQPPLTPSARQPASPVPPAHRRELSAEELATLPLQALLVRSGRISIDQLSEALRENVSTGRTVEDIAVSRGWIAAAELDELRRAKAAHAPEAPAAPAPAPQPPPQAPVAVAPPPEPVQMQPVQPVPVPQPQPLQAVQAVPAPVAPPPDPVPAPAPVGRTEPPPIVETTGNGGAEGSVGVFLTLADGERIWVGRFASPEAGEQHAQEVIDALMRPEPGVWPRFGNRLVRPDSVVAVEVSKRRDD